MTTKGGPLHSTTVVVYYLYQQAFVYFHAGYAAAIACLLFVAILVITVVQMRVSRDPDLDASALMARSLRLRAPVALAPGAAAARPGDAGAADLDAGDQPVHAGGDPALPARAALARCTGRATPRPGTTPRSAHWLLNSTIVSVTCVVSNLVLCSLAGYAFARIPFAGSRMLFLGILATLMVPFQVVMIPTLLIVKQLGLVDSLPALIVPNLVTPFGIYLLRQFFLSLPAELEEAAIIDGAGRLRILFSILLPLMGPPLSTRRRAHLPPGVERLPVAAGRHLLPRDDDRAARPGQLPERALHQLAGADGRAPCSASCPCCCCSCSASATSSARSRPPGSSRPASDVAVGVAASPLGLVGTLVDGVCGRRPRGCGGVPTPSLGCGRSARDPVVAAAGSRSGFRLHGMAVSPAGAGRGGGGVRFFVVGGG